MRFEALNQIFKHIAAGGNFQNTVGRCADMWSIQVAMERRCAQMCLLNLEAKTRLSSVSCECVVRVCAMHAELW